MAGLVDDQPVDQRALEESGRTGLRVFSVPNIQRFNETAMRDAVRRDLAWLLNTVALSAHGNLTGLPEVSTSVVNFGVPDLTGKALTLQVRRERARKIRDAIASFEPRIDQKTLRVEEQGSRSSAENALSYLIQGDIGRAVDAMPVRYFTDVEIDTGAAVVRE